MAKYYVVWEGKKPGIYTNWAECERQIKGVAGAKYMSFSDLESAETAFKKNYEDYKGTKPAKVKKVYTAEELARIGSPVRNSIAVDGASSSTDGATEYQGVQTHTKKRLFHNGPFPGTNNIAEFLAIVHALAYCKKHNITVPIYSDSKNAIAWVKRKRIGTKFVQTSSNRETFELLDRALLWLNQNTYQNKILKWETAVWGENPADFGRK
ncbi:MAG TPA: ribonuclease H family protein [Flavobacteriales bacterium]|nr:ribonuclease H family protein [Flavobacteriales bacterium]